MQSKAPDLTHVSLVEIMKIAASEELSSDARKHKGWFREEEDKLVAAIEERNRAQIASIQQINLILLVNTSLFNTSCWLQHN